MDQFQALRRILSGEEDATRSEYNYSGCYQRFSLAHNDLLNDSALVGKRDIAVLLRHILRREQEIQGGVVQRLKIYSTEHWPSQNEYEECGIHRKDLNANHCLIEAVPWVPDWLTGADVSSIERPIVLEEQRQIRQLVEGDLFLEEMHLQRYRCSGQSEAVRAVLSATPGSTLLVNMPTGSGKSLCIHLPALLNSKWLGVTIVVIPTTALAIDQERALTPFITHPTAYFGGELPDIIDRNKGIRDRIRNGTQRIVFTSPESLLHSLRAPVYEAAKKGYLRIFAVDEAHIIDQWGDEFRPEFQEIAGLRKDLLRICGENPFQTVLLSATISRNTLDTITTLFGKPGPFAMVSAVQLRPEPSYWLARCENQLVKKTRILEAINHLPRPLILYTTMVQDAQWWKEELQRVGYRRVKVITSKTTNIERLKILQQWRDKEFDIMIATSAFGLGVDQSDVRVVLHACVPENIDRYYQEVGRGGRDGKASLSLMIYTDDDVNTAKGLNQRTIIGINRGLQRWSSMFHSKDRLENGVLRVPLDVPPSFEEGDIDMNGRQHEAWHRRTLILMARAGLIELDAQPPDWMRKIEEDLEDNDRDERPYQYLRILNEGHLRRLIWEEKVEPSRKQTELFSKQGNQLMQDVLDSNKCLANIFADVYTINSSSCNATVGKSCGGCAYCRSMGKETYVGIMPIPRPIWSEVQYGSQQLQNITGHGKTVAVFYRTKDIDRLHPESKSIERFITWLLVQGVRNMVAPPEKLKEWGGIITSVPNAHIFCFHEYQPLYMPKLPTLIYTSPNETIDINLYRNESPLPIRILLLPDNAPDRERQNSKLLDNIPLKKYGLREFNMEVG